MAAETHEPERAFSPVGVILRFIHRLRMAGIPISMVEALDAAQALEHLDLSRRAELRAALLATLIKADKHRADFDAVFDAYFGRLQPSSRPARPLPGIQDDADVEAQEHFDSPEDADIPSDQMLQSLLEALRSNDMEGLRLMAMAAASQFGGMKAGQTASERAYMYRIMRQLDLSSLLQRALQQDREDGLTGLDARVSRDEQLRGIEEFRRLIAEAVRQRLASIAGPREAADMAASGPLEDVDFLGASPDQLRQMRAAIQPLARKLAARIAHRLQRRHRGRLDVRRTVRHSLSTGGVPLEPDFRHPKVSKPDLCMLCDVSGSVAEFAEFTLSLLNAMHDEFPRIRSFAFIDGVDDITDLFVPGRAIEPKQLLWRRQLVWADGHSDYDHVFGAFWTKFGRGCVSPKTTLIITGDARNNFKGDNLADLKEIAAQARRVYWLNPEPRSEWNEGDSIIGRYEPCCDAVVEVRNLRQLSDFIYHLEA